MPKVNGKYKKKLDNPQYNKQALKPGQVSREQVNAFKEMQTKTNAGSYNLRKSQ